jgi:hypothetical protein
MFLTFIKINLSIFLVQNQKSISVLFCLQLDVTVFVIKYPVGMDK